MTYGTYAKPRLAGRGFARLLWSAFASLPYRSGLASANACYPFSPVAVDGAGYGAALLWGEPL